MPGTKFFGWSVGIGSDMPTQVEEDEHDSFAIAPPMVVMGTYVHWCPPSTVEM
jgi:hypothetical protein